MLMFVVARTRLDRYEALRRQFEGLPDVQIILDRRVGERRAAHGPFAGVDRRSPIERRQDFDIDAFMTLGWLVVDIEERNQ